MLAPVPVFMGVATGFMPVARVLMITGVCFAVVVVEGARGAVGLLGVLLLAQALVFALLWLLVAAFTARLLARLPRTLATGAVVLALGAAIAVAGAAPWYRTPFRAAAVQSTLWEIFE
jgi:hypothetical protein